MAPGAPSGSRLPQKRSTSRRTRESIESVAFQIGFVVAVERNRNRLNQTQLAEKVGGGANQSHITAIENGQPGGLTSTQLDRLFKVLGLDSGFSLQKSFLKWWQ